MTVPFTKALITLMESRGFNDESLASLMVDKGYPANDRSIRYWRSGYMPANWDVVVPLLASIFSVPPTVFFTGISNVEANDHVDIYDANMDTPPPSYSSFSSALQSRIPHRGAAELARQLTAEGFPTSRQQVSTWLSGCIPRDGLVLLPILASILDIDLAHLIPHKQTKGE